MADDLDMTQERIEREEVLRERYKQPFELESGVSGECERCGEEWPRLVRGACARCRDRLGLD